MPIRIFAALFVSWLAFSAVLYAQNLPGDDRRWSRLDTPHFTFLSQIDEVGTREMADDLERLRSVLAELVPEEQLNSPNLTYIYLFADHETFRPFQLQHQGKPIEGVSYLTPHRHANYAALNADPQIDPTRFLYSQFIHQLLNEQLPQLPLWFRQGLSEYYSTFEGDAEGAKIGRPSRQHLRNYGFGGTLQVVDGTQPVGELKEPPTLSMEELLSLEQSPKDFTQRSLYLAKCWGLVHYLLNDPERRQQTTTFVRQVVLGEEDDIAFEKAFPYSTVELEDRVYKYLAKGNFPYLRLAMSIQPAQSALYRPLPRHEALFYLGDLLLHSAPDRRLDAANYLELALTLARSSGLDHGPSHAALGEVAELAGDMEAASRSYALAVEHAGGDAQVQFLYGQSLLATLGKQRPVDDGAKKRLENAVHSLEESTKTRPDFAEAWANLGFAYGLEEIPSGDAVAALSRALELLPGRTDIALNLLLAHAKEGQRPGADAVFRRLQWIGAPPADLARGQEILLQMDYQEANRLVRKENRLADAVALFARIQAESQDATLRQRAAERIEKFASALEHNRFASLYVQAVEGLRSSTTHPQPAESDSLGEILDELARIAKPGLQAKAVADLRLRHQGAQP